MKEIDDDSKKYLTKFYNKAKKLNKSDLSDIRIVETEDVDCWGFTFEDKKIFYHVDSDCVCIEESGDTREISIGELR